jgi:hypothetical protein
MRRSEQNKRGDEKSVGYGIIEKKVKQNERNKKETVEV